MKKIILLCVSLIICYSVIAQKEPNTWYFGDFCGIDFNSGTAVAITNSGMSEFEGCAALSDRNTGAILFYTDGITVYDASHAVMMNGTGLTGDPSSAQSAVIVPKPNSATEYYIFTAGEYYSNGIGGYCYSIVDMTLNGGLGAVTATKNVLLYAPACEKLAVVKNATSTGFWIATHEWAGANFVLYELTSLGVSAPVVSSVGTSYIGTLPIGCMKFSRDGTRLATILSGSNAAEIYDFNSSTGVVSNPIQIGPIAVNLYVYGISFSPNGQLLYVDEENDNNIYQFDLSSGVAVTINASKLAVGANSAGALQTIQLAPDGKLYIAKNGSGYVATIDNPDVAGMGCNYVDTGLYLAGRTCAYGLPGFIESLFMPVNPPVALFTANDSTICPGSCLSFTNLSVNATSYQWLFPGGTPASDTSANPSGICYQTTGTYDVTLTASNGSGINTYTYPNYISVFPSPTPPNFTQSGDTLFATIGYTGYQWYFGSDTIAGATNYYCVATQSGNYNLVVKDENGCSVGAGILNVIAGVFGAGSSEFGVSVYPNPTSGAFQIKYYSEKNSLVTIELINSLGQIVYREEKQMKQGTNLLSFAESLNGAGIYLLKISGGEKIITEKIVVEK